MARFPARHFPNIDSVLSYCFQRSRTNTYNRTSEESRILDCYDNFHQLRDHIHSSLQQYCEQVLDVNTAELAITQSWLNFNEPGSSHHQHRHLNSAVSGVYYLTEGPNYIEFHSNVSGNYHLGERSQLRDVEVITVNRGELILFPSWIPHAVPVNDTDRRRITLSFNTQFRGIMGRESELTLVEI